MNADQQILTQLAKEYREVAFAPVNEERRALWKALNGLRECRPLIMIDQLPWHELDVDGDLKLRCRDADARIVEDALRTTYSSRIWTCPPPSRGTTTALCAGK